MSAFKWFESICIQFPARLLLGGAFCFAGSKKLMDVQSFAEAIKGFKVLNVDTHEQLIINAAYSMPWIELIAGLLLILGLWTRAATMVIAVMLLVFIAALIHVITDDTISASCSCFGDVKVICTSPEIGWCMVWRDVVMLLPAIYLLWRGGGKLAIDARAESKLEAQISNPEPDLEPR
tara:strand:+ start:25613 stop:26146 length:534 start_codon:yes stop_codon:yes gene_type:complete